METFCGKAVAHKSDFDWRHDESSVDDAVEALERASPNLDLFNGSFNSTRRMLTVSRHRADLG
jgi:hypothetical protein